MAPHPLTVLFARAQRQTGLTQRGLAEAVGSSLRTVSRWSSGRSLPSRDQMLELARLVHPTDADLAAEMAEAHGESLVSLGLVTAGLEPAPRRPQKVPFGTAELLELVVCSVADHANQPPKAVRELVLLTLKRAREVGLDPADVAAQLPPALGGPGEM